MVFVWIVLGQVIAYLVPHLFVIPVAVICGIILGIIGPPLFGDKNGLS